MYFYWKRLCILIVSLCYSCLYVVYVFLDAATLTEVFPCIFLSCKANARVNLAKTGHAPHSSQLLCCSMYCELKKRRGYSVDCELKDMRGCSLDCELKNRGGFSVDCEIM